jgi:aminoglycoside phosphotransferase (APT) family kinase protein
MLTQSEAVAYLLKRKLVNSTCVVESDLLVVDASRRNRNYKVMCESGPSYLLKQGVGPSGIATVAYEAMVYRIIQSERNRVEFGHYLPLFYCYDSEEKILILELLRGAQDVRDYHTQCGCVPRSLAAATGRTLGTLHRLVRGEKDLGQSRELVTHNPPWPLSLHQPDLDVFREISGANVETIKIIQQFPEFCELLNALRQSWCNDSFIHFDIRWDNWMICPRSAGERKYKLRLIDWELAGIGDPCWDVGSVFNDYLSLWLLSIPVTGETPPNQWLELARFPLSRIQPAVRSFWKAYSQTMQLDYVDTDVWLLRAVKFAAAKLVQTAFEQMQVSMQLTGNAIVCLQLSLNILRRPREAIVHLLGVPFKG